MTVTAGGIEGGVGRTVTVVTYCNLYTHYIWNFRQSIGEWRCMKMNYHYHSGDYVGKLLSHD